jgi:hypothetical protein
MIHVMGFASRTSVKVAFTGVILVRSGRLSGSLTMGRFCRRFAADDEARAAKASEFLRDSRFLMPLFARAARGLYSTSRLGASKEAILAGAAVVASWP